MKNFLFLLVACFIVQISQANVPEKIAVAFHAKYGKAANVHWKNNVINYTVSFTLMNEKLHATYDKKGEWLQSVKTLHTRDLPEIIKKSFQKSAYADWKILSSFEEYLPREQPIYHLRTAKGSVKRKNLVFDSQGNIIKGK